MPSDFISLLSADLDLNSPKSLYSKESVYDLLPDELQLPPSTTRNAAEMSQNSSGGAGPPPAGDLASDAASTSSSIPVGGPRSDFPAPSSPSMHSCSSPTDLAHVHNSRTPCEESGSQGAVMALGAESEAPGASVSSGGGGGGGAQQAPPHQGTPSKRRTVLNVSPPPEDLFEDSRLSCQDEPAQDSEQSGSLWMDDSASNFSLASSGSYNDNTQVPRKSRKRTTRQRPGPKSGPAKEDSMDVFDADSARGPHFVLSQLGSDTKTCPKGSPAEGPPMPDPNGPGTLSRQHPARSEGKELKILVQPETQHRARYLTEGSRGSVKDRTQQGFPTVKLEGVKEPVVLQVFVGNDTERVKPHGFYQACRVTGRNTTACTERDIEGTTVIEVHLDPSNNMTLAVDCVGILKLRNADVEARIGVAGSKKKSTRARLVFRVNVPRPDGSVLTLQVPSSPILCTQPAGVPEIVKKSLHSCSAKGGEELFIIGKNFLKGTKVIFQDNAADEQSWKAEAEIDMELFHQNHLIVKVPPYHSLAITSPVTVGLYAVTNAGRSHDVQSFTYTPEPGATDVTLKEEALSLATPCPVQEQMEEIQSGSCSPDSVPVSLVKREEVTPMEVSNTASAGCIFQQALDIRTSQQMDTSSSLPKIGTPFSSTRDPELQTALYATAEPLSTIQDLDIALTDSFQQRFLSKSGESLPRERTRGKAGAITGLLQMVESPAQPSQLSLFPQNSADQLSRLPAEGYSAPSLVQQVLEAAVQQQLSSVLFSPAPSAESTQHPVRRDVNSPQLQSPEGSLAKQQQQQQQQQQPQHVLENLQQQLQADLFEPDIPMHCGIFGGGSQSETTEQQVSPQCIVHNLQPAEGLLCRGSQQQQQEQQQAALFQQAEEFLSIQTSNFLQQRTSHPSPTQQLFHSPNPLAETHDPQGALFHTQKPSSCQGQVQATLFQDNLTVLTGSTLSPKQEASPSNLFLSQSVSPSQLSDDSSPQQLAFLTSMRTSATETQSVFQPQRSPMDQSTSMEQQQSSQQQPQHPGSLFRNASPNSIGNTLSQSQQKLQPGLLYCSNTLETMSNSLPSHETQDTSVRFPQASLVTIRNQEEPAEPMSFQDQSSLVGSLPASEPHQQDLFRGQWSIQLASSSSNPSKQAASIFSPQSAISPLQGRVGSQELSQAAVFTAQNGVPGVQTSTSSTMQRSEALFQIAISGTMSQHNQAQQAGLFLYGIQNECSQPILSPGPTLSNQLPDPSGPKQQKNESQILSLFSESMSLSGSMQNGMSASQDMQKIDDLLESLQEQGNNILGSS